MHDLTNMQTMFGDEMNKEILKKMQQKHHHHMVEKYLQ